MYIFEFEIAITFDRIALSSCNFQGHVFSVEAIYGENLK